MRLTGLFVVVAFVSYTEASFFGRQIGKLKKWSANRAAKKAEKKRAYQQSNASPQELQTATTSGAFCIDQRRCKKDWEKSMGNQQVKSSDWLKGIDDSVNVGRDLTIPGTHDTFSLVKDRGNFKAYYGAIPGLGSKTVTEGQDTTYSKTRQQRKGEGAGYDKEEVGGGLVITQVFDLEEQLNLGIRAFDLRMVPFKGLVRFTHNHIMQPFYLHLELNNLLAWLRDHPTEFVIFKYKATKGLKAKDVQKMVSDRSLCGPGICTSIENCQNPCLWETKESGSGDWASASVGQLRGKVVFWPKKDKVTKDTSTNLQGGSIRNARRFGACAVTNLKGQCSARNVMAALNGYWKEAWGKHAKFGQNTATKIFMFYLSATGSTASYGPVCMATGQKCLRQDYDNAYKNEVIFGLNNMMYKHLNERMPQTSLGMVMIDFPGHALVCKLVENNYRRLSNREEL